MNNRFILTRLIALAAVISVLVFTLSWWLFGGGESPYGPLLCIFVSLAVFFCLVLITILYAILVNKNRLARTYILNLKGAAYLKGSRADEFMASADLLPVADQERHTQPGKSVCGPLVEKELKGSLAWSKVHRIRVHPEKLMIQLRTRGLRKMEIYCPGRQVFQWALEFITKNTPL